MRTSSLTVNNLKDYTNNMAIKDLHKRYKGQTPLFWRKVGDSILLLGTTMVTLFATYNYSKEYIIGATILSTLGKIVTNFFSEDVPEPPTTQP